MKVVEGRRKGNEYWIELATGNVMSPSRCVAALSPHPSTTHPQHLSFTASPSGKLHTLRSKDISLIQIKVISSNYYTAMSSRALRKAQQRAEEERLAALAAAPPSDDEEEGEEESEPVASKKPNIFAMLNAELEEAEAEQEDPDEEEPDGDTEAKPTTTSKSKKKKKKKKNKGKSKGKETEDAKDSDDEDFDSALAQALKSTAISSTGTTQSATSTASASTQLHSLFHIDSRHLDLENEMRKLFGRAATSREAPTDARQQPRGQRQPGGRPLLATGGRRNVFVQAGENWPRESSGGLSMELVEKNAHDGTVIFRYAHSRAYQDVQRQFNDCVRSMGNPSTICFIYQKALY